MRVRTGEGVGKAAPPAFKEGLINKGTFLGKRGRPLGVGQLGSMWPVLWWLFSKSQHEFVNVNKEM